MSSSVERYPVLLIEDDHQVYNEIRNLMSFLDYSTEYLTDLEGLASLLASTDRVYSAILLGHIIDDDQRRRALEIIDQSDRQVAVILINQASDNLDRYRQEFSFIMSWLGSPYKHQPVIDALEQATRYSGADVRASLAGEAQVPKLVGDSQAMKAVQTMIEQVAKTDASVLILGESGTGKEVVARNIHALSKRHRHHFVPVNCGAIPADLLESELFGHEKGAFTGAITARQGRFELADEGTLFLDEIGDMSLPMQVKLLRVLQERTFERVGSNKSMTADVRILAATHRNLEQNIHDGKFREDLFYRLNVFPIEIPPLRERLDDVPLLLQDQIEKLAASQRGNVRLTARATEALCRYDWPGNVRELANLVERLTILYPGGAVDVQQLPEKYRGRNYKPAASDFNPAKLFAAMDDELQDSDEETAFSLEDTMRIEPGMEQLHQPVSAQVPELTDEGLDLKEHIAQVEIDIIRQALDASKGVVAHAANLLKMRRTTLVEKLKKYGINS